MSFRLHLHLYRFAGTKGANSYWECRCGRRQVFTGRGYTPIDHEWLAGRPEWEAPGPMRPPPKPR